MSRRTPSPLWTADDVYFASVDGDVVVLDVSKDRYICLAGAGVWLAPAPDGRLESTDETAAAALVEAGLAATRPPARPRKAPVPPARDLSRVEGGQGPGPVLAGLSLVHATLAFRRAPLDRLLPLSRPRLSVPAPDEGRLARAVADWRAALPWIPGEGECLQRAFQLRRLLAGRGVGADWVFGVRTWPFAAHCWVQVGDRVVGDRLERVRGYTPIMVA